MARMLGRVSPSWCPICRGEPGPDCPDRGKGKRQMKRRERAEFRRVDFDDSPEQGGHAVQFVEAPDDGDQFSW